MTLLGTVTTFLALAVLVLLGLLLWRERVASRLASAAKQLESIVRSGRFADRVRVSGATNELTNGANLLLEQLALKDMQIRERERSLVGLLGGLHEGIAVHR